MDEPDFSDFTISRSSKSGDCTGLKSQGIRFDPEGRQIINVGDFFETGKRTHCIWRLIRITRIEKKMHPQGNALRNFYKHDVLACNDIWYTIPGKGPFSDSFCEGAPIMDDIKKVEFNDLPKYLGAPYVTVAFEKVFKGE